jgi:hypothetical protein
MHTTCYFVQSGGEPQGEEEGRQGAALVDASVGGDSGGFTSVIPVDVLSGPSQPRGHNRSEIRKPTDHSVPYQLAGQAAKGIANIKCHNHSMGSFVHQGGYAFMHKLTAGLAPHAVLTGPNGSSQRGFDDIASGPGRKTSQNTAHGKGTQFAVRLAQAHKPGTPVGLERSYREVPKQEVHHKLGSISVSLSIGGEKPPVLKP